MLLFRQIIFDLPLLRTCFPFNVGGCGRLQIGCSILLKTGSLDSTGGEFSLAKPSWYMSHCTMFYKNGQRMRDFLGLFVFIVV